MWMRQILLMTNFLTHLSVATSFAHRKFFWRGVLASLRKWLAGSSGDPDAGTAAVLGCAYLLLTDLVDIFGDVHQHLPLVVANSVRASIMVLVLALLPAGRYLGPRLGHTRRWMFVMAAGLAAFKSARSIATIYRTHSVGSAIIACIALTFAVDVPGRVHKWMTARRARCFFAAAFLAVCFAHAVLQPKASDIGYTSISAIRAMTTGLNPYKVDLDDFDKPNTGDKRFTGYKYSPLLPMIYFPAVKLFGALGVSVANSIILIFTAWIVSRLCSRIVERNGLWSAILLLASPLVGWSVIVYQVNDLVAVLPICVAVLVWDRRPGLAGLLLGVSGSIKIMPAPIAMALLLPLALPTARKFVAGIAIGLIPVVVFAALDPSAFFNNVVLFEIVRPSSPGSLLLGIPFIVIWSLRIAFAATFLATAAASVIGDWSIHYRMTAYVMLTIVLLLTSQINQDYYWLWWIPVFIPLLCAKSVARASREMATQ